VVIRPKRLGWAVGTAFFAPFFVLSLGMVFPDVFAPVLKPFELDDNVRHAPAWAGVLLAALFGSFVVSLVLQLISPGLRLTSEGFEIFKYKLAWSEVDDFERAGFFHVRVLYWREHELSPREKLSVALGAVDLYLHPAYIRTSYHTGDEALDVLLRRWRLTYGR
jgi:hypothetical protein